MHFIELGSDILNQVSYRGEGNSSIVIALKNQAKVIRLLKKDGKLMSSIPENHVMQHPMQSIKFIHLVMKPLIHPFFNSATELVHLKSDFINELNKVIESHRPSHRLDKKLNLYDQYALVMDDLCTLPFRLTRELKVHDFIGPTISIEIKPKQGFLPIYRSVMKSSVNDQFTINRLRNCCLYGSTQILKLERGLIHQISDYCPINLFSGCPFRMKDALEKLLKNPQNNLRIFRDRHLAYGENNHQQVKVSNIFENFFETNDEMAIKMNHKSEHVHHNHVHSHHFQTSCHHQQLNQQYNHASDEERLVDLLIQCLLDDYYDKNSETDEPSSDMNENLFSNGDTCLQHLLETKCKRCDTNPSSKKHKHLQPAPVSHKLPKSCVLSRILRVQKLDSIGAHEASNMLDWVLEHSNVNNNVIEELSKTELPSRLGFHQQMPDETQEQYFTRKVWEFLVSLTAKDCSIIVSMRRITQGHYESIVANRPDLKSHLLREERSGSYYLFNVGITDLDQKLPAKISRIRDRLNLILKLRDHIKKDASASIKPVWLAK